MTIDRSDIQEWLDAWNSHDLDRILSLFAEDAVVHQPQNPVPLDKSGIRTFFSALFRTYPDIHFEGDGFLIDGREAASWEIVTGTMTGAFTDPATGRVIPPTGKSFRIPGAMRIQYDAERKIRAVRIYWDRALFAQQLGLARD